MSRWVYYIYVGSFWVIDGFDIVLIFVGLNVYGYWYDDGLLLIYSIESFSGIEL